MLSRLVLRISEFGRILVKSCYVGIIANIEYQASSTMSKPLRTRANIEI